MKRTEELTKLEKAAMALVTRSDADSRTYRRRAHGSRGANCTRRALDSQIHRPTAPGRGTTETFINAGYKQ
jgi:hypothetical protein